jgi:hypothetical protein
MAAPARFYEVNYLPVANSGTQMWSSYNGAQYQTDMGTAKSYGFTSMRVFLQAATGAFDFPYATSPPVSGPPTSGELANLKDFYNRSVTAGIRLHLTLFDLWPGNDGSPGGAIGEITACKTWLSDVIGALTSIDPALANITMVELKNEVTFSSATAYTGGFDSGWPAGTPQYGQYGQVAVVWAEQMIPYARTLLPAGMPVTISTTNVGQFGLGDLTAFYAAVNGTAAAPDFWDHHMVAGNDPSYLFGYMQSIIAAVGYNAGNLIIGESDCTNAPTGSFGTVQAYQNQADYQQANRWNAQQLGVAMPSPWCLFDLNPSSEFPSGQTFGLLSTTATAHLAGTLYQTYPPGTPVPAVSINGTMTSPQTDVNGNTMPIRWSLYKGSGGAQPITSNVVTYASQQAVLLTGSSGTTPANPPALQNAPVSLVLTPGNTYTFQCMLAASGSYGSPNLQIGWYSQTGTLLSSVSGPALLPGTGFGSYSVSGKPPANAWFAVLSVNTGGNAGNIWVANATWTDVAPVTSAYPGPAVYPGFALYPAAGPPGPGGTVVNQWAATMAQPAGLNANPPPDLQSVVVPLNGTASVGGGTGIPTAGNWLFCLVGWNQDDLDATMHAITIAVADDIHSFWRPGIVPSGPAGVSQASADSRTAVWYTPNLARVPQFVYVAPSGSSAAIAVLVVEVAGIGPWDKVDGLTTAYQADAQSVTLSLPAPS